MCVTGISITLKESDMTDHYKRKSGDSYGTFLIENPGAPKRKLTYDDLLQEIGEFDL